MTEAEIAAEVLAATREGRQVAPFSARVAGFDLARGYRVAALIRAAREAAGERRVGRKLGFTNRGLWPLYGVAGPIVGDLWDGTVGEGAEVPLEGLTEPRIEPEIAFGIGRSPGPGMDDAALMACMDWVAHGVEIVRSPFPGWRFAAADCVAGLALHGLYRIGPRQAVTAATAGDWAARLGAATARLRRNGAVVAEGGAGAIAGGPLGALRHLLAHLGEDTGAGPLRPGEIVTTGTLTDALPVAPGEVWETEIGGAPLPGLRLVFSPARGPGASPPPASR